MSNSPFVFDVTEQEFEAKVLQKSHEVPVVVDFWAPWCGPCRGLGPILERIVDERSGSVLLAKVNTDEEQNLAQQFGVSGIPHVVAIRKGRAVLNFTGLLPEGQLGDFFNRLAPSEAEQAAESAAPLEKSNPAEAERLYRQALEKDAQQEEAILGLARVCLAQNKDAEAAAVLEPIGPLSEFGAEAEQLRARLWLRTQAKDLPDVPVLRAKVKAEPRNAAALCDLGSVLAAKGESADALEALYQAGALDRQLARGRVKETMVKLFFVVGARSELADAYRDKLTRLLY